MMQQLQEDLLVYVLTMGSLLFPAVVVLTNLVHTDQV